MLKPGKSRLVTVNNICLVAVPQAAFHRSCSFSPFGLGEPVSSVCCMCHRIRGTWWAEPGSGCHSMLAGLTSALLSTAPRPRCTLDHWTPLILSTPGSSQPQDHTCLFFCRDLPFCPVLASVLPSLCLWPNGSPQSPFQAQMALAFCRDPADHQENGLLLSTWASTPVSSAPAAGALGCNQEVGCVEIRPLCLAHSRLK